MVSANKIYEDFQTPLSEDWFWGLGTWKAENGVLTGYESGKRRHGPVKIRSLIFDDASFEYDFKLNGKASFSSLTLNGEIDGRKNHLLNVLFNVKNQSIRVILHTAPGGFKFNLIDQPIQIKKNQWNHAKVCIKQNSLEINLDGQSISAQHEAIRYRKFNFGLGGDSGGPKGAEAGTLEFKNLHIKNLNLNHSDLSQQVHKEINNILAENLYPGASLKIIHNRSTIFKNSYGYENIAKKTPFTEKQLCWLASTGKMYTATLMAVLVDEGILSFDDPIAKYYPEFANIKMADGSKPHSPVLLRHALSHTTGIPNKHWLEKHKNSTPTNPGKFKSYFAPEKPEDFVEVCIQLGLVEEPGTKMMYGHPIDLAACVAEKATGVTFQKLMEQKVLKPLGFTNTTIQPGDKDLRNIATLYQSSGDGVFEHDPLSQEIAQRQKSRLSSAGGGVFSNTDELSQLLQFHLNRGVFKGNQLISKQTLQQLYQPQPGTKGTYGLGFQIRKIADRTLLMHPGYSGPVGWIDFENNITGTIMMQSNTVGRDKHHKRIISIVNRMLPKTN